MKVRLRQLSFWSQAKILLFASLFATGLFALIMTGLLLAGFEVTRTAKVDPLPATLFVILVASALMVGVSTLLHILGLALARALPWQGPKVELKDGAGVSTIFE